MPDQVSMSQAAYERLKASAAAIADVSASTHTVLGGVIDHIREVLANAGSTATTPQDVTDQVNASLDQLDAAKADLVALATSGQSIEFPPAAGGDSTTSGTSGDDTLGGGAGNDTILGGQGDDTLVAGSGNDTLVSGDGNDTLTAGLGNDTVEGGATSGADASASGAQIPDGSVVQPPAPPEV